MSGAYLPHNGHNRPQGRRFMNDGACDFEDCWYAHGPKTQGKLRQNDKGGSKMEGFQKGGKHIEHRNICT